MNVFNKTFALETKKQFQIIDITKEVLDALKQSKVKNGQIAIFCPHTTASVRINHFEPLLLQDVMKLMYRLAPIENNYAHDFFEIRTEIQAGERSNGHAHIKAFLLGSSETIPVMEGKSVLGFRQSVFFIELDGGRTRRFVVSVLGE